MQNLCLNRQAKLPDHCKFMIFTTCGQVRRRSPDFKRVWASRPAAGFPL
jgi:hypothetical protein